MFHEIEIAHLYIGLKSVQKLLPITCHIGTTVKIFETCKHKEAGKVEAQEGTSVSEKKLKSFGGGSGGLTLGKISATAIQQDLAKIYCDIYPLQFYLNSICDI